MALLQEKPIRAYQTKNKTFVCPVCATDEERENAKPDEMITEDVIHDDNPMFCHRCKKKIEQETIPQKEKIFYRRFSWLWKELSVFTQIDVSGIQLQR